MSRRYYSVKLPVKTYIRKYIEFLLGDEIRLSQDHHIKSYLLLLFEKKYVGRYYFKNIMNHYNDEVKLWITWDRWNDIGFEIPEKKVVNFNYYIENHFVESLFLYLQYRLREGVYKKIAIEEFCDKIGITPEDIDYDSLRRKIDRNKNKYSWIKMLSEEPSQDASTPNGALSFSCPS